MSVNADKALQVRPPIAVYVLETPGGGSQTFEIPGVPNVIGGAAPEGAHTMITNFLSVQADETEGDGNGSPFYIAFGRPLSALLPAALLLLVTVRTQRQPQRDAYGSASERLCASTCPTSTKRAQDLR